jgi:hypothetical protein
MAQNAGWGPARSGGFLRILGIIYLVKRIRQRRAEHRPGTDSSPDED